MVAKINDCRHIFNTIINYYEFIKGVIMSVADKLRPMLYESMLLERDSNIEKIELLKELFDAIVASTPKDLKRYYTQRDGRSRYDMCLGFDPYALTGNSVYKFNQTVEPSVFILSSGSEYTPVTDRVVVLFKSSSVYGGNFVPEDGTIILTGPWNFQDQKTIDEFLFTIPSPSFKDVINKLRGVKQANTGLQASSSLLMHEISHMATHNKSGGKSSDQYGSYSDNINSDKALSTNEKFTKYVNMHDEVESELTAAMQKFLISIQYNVSNVSFESFKDGVMKGLYQHSKKLYDESSLKKIYKQLYTVYTQLTTAK